MLAIADISVVQDPFDVLSFVLKRVLRRDDFPTDVFPIKIIDFPLRLFGNFWAAKSSRIIYFIFFIVSAGFGG